jgi:hypothetical protein
VRGVEPAWGARQFSSRQLFKTVKMIIRFTFII